MEVADAEAVGALEATKRATAREGAGEIWLCLDNRGVVDQLRNAATKNSTSQEVVDETRQILKAWADKTPGRLARVLWVPGHMGIRGNEPADTQAKLGCQGLVTEHRFSLAGARRWRRDQLRLDYEGWWKEQKGYRPPGTSVPTEPPFRNSRYKGLTRIELGHILAARTGDGDTTAHLDAGLATKPRNEDTGGPARHYPDHGAKGSRTSSLKTRKRHALSPTCFTAT
ncbi:putative double-stranded RNA/RNA-DNA hybrid binding protein [Ceratocystis lukuohia]|uniref:Double-stranded RNA/RNA-DNA hybrid binding protein n=1 Tax=Ceratocystis lukuohia TaxID=2019550 RepID=A0ABR4MG29_9PEZI